MLTSWNLDESGRLVLEMAWDCLIRFEQGRDAIANDGPVVKDRIGEPRPHQASTIERDNRQLLLKYLKALNLDSEIKPMESPPWANQHRNGHASAQKNG